MSLLWVSQLGQLSLPSPEVGKLEVIHILTWIMRVKAIKTA